MKVGGGYLFGGVRCGTVPQGAPLASFCCPFLPVLVSRALVRQVTGALFSEWVTVYGRSSVLAYGPVEGGEACG